MAMFLSKALAGKPLLPLWITSKSVDPPSKRCANGERLSLSSLVGVIATISVSDGFSEDFVIELRERGEVEYKRIVKSFRYLRV